MDSKQFFKILIQVFLGKFVVTDFDKHLCGTFLKRLVYAGLF